MLAAVREGIGFAAIAVKVRIGCARYDLACARIGIACGTRYIGKQCAVRASRAASRVLVDALIVIEAAVFA